MEKEILTMNEGGPAWRPKPEVATATPAFRAVAAESLWRALTNCARIVIAIVASGRMVRLVGPHHRPLERHEFEDAAYRDLRQFGGGAF